VGFPIEHAVALLDDGEADRLRQVALPRARRPEEERVGVLRDPVLSQNWVRLASMDVPARPTG
jgi:hypothetical protein